MTEWEWKIVLKKDGFSCSGGVGRWEQPKALKKPAPSGNGFMGQSWECGFLSSLLPTPERFIGTSLGETRHPGGTGGTSREDAHWCLLQQKPAGAGS